MGLKDSWKNASMGVSKKHLPEYQSQHQQVPPRYRRRTFHKPDIPKDWMILGLLGYEELLDKRLSLYDTAHALAVVTDANAYRIVFEDQTVEWMPSVWFRIELPRVPDSRWSTGRRKHALGRYLNGMMLHRTNGDLTVRQRTKLIEYIAPPILTHSFFTFPRGRT